MSILIRIHFHLIVINVLIKCLETLHSVHKYKVYYFNDNVNFIQHDLRIIQIFNVASNIQ